MTNFAPELFLRFMESKIVLSGNTTYAKYFIGNSYLAQISEAQVPFANVTFEPGCRNNWHIHKADNGGGQMLVGVAGRGWYQEEGKSAVEILPGTVIHIPANVKHWHGAAKYRVENIWLKPVSDAYYQSIGKGEYRYWTP